jgi:phosphoribosylglycinamide formyltransferase-1
VLSNKSGAGVLARVAKYGIPSECFNKEDFYGSDIVLENLKIHADYVILAGFLWKIPSNIIHAFHQKILNIHPSLLPKYGGRGMYGAHVHRSVLANKESTSGITIHFVNEEYDKGAILFQQSVKIQETDNEHDLASKIHELEYFHYPRVIEQLVTKDLKKP